jgi:hypothetical protein
MKVCEGVDVQIHDFLISALDEGERVTSRPGCFTLKERALGIHWLGAWLNS